MNAAACVDLAAPRSPEIAPPTTVLNCFSIDVEEYFDAEVFHGRLPPSERLRLPRRAVIHIERIAELLEHGESRATFFVLGASVRYLAPLLRSLAERGHEIACHGFDHQHLARLNPVLLREDLRRARGVIEDSVGVSPRGYRAPTFSVTRKTAWALDVIIEEGFEYDASIFPIRHDRYGVPDAPVEPFWAEAPSGARIVEFPPLTLDWRILRLPVGGGGYMRLLPGSVVRRCIAARERANRPTMLYVHPWEFDPDQPRIPLPPVAQWRHRVNLHKSEPKLQRLLECRRFNTAAAVLQAVRDAGKLPTYSLK